MSELLLINPRRRTRKAGTKRRKAATHSRKRRTKTIVLHANPKRRRRKTLHARVNPATHKRRRRKGGGSFGRSLKLSGIAMPVAIGAGGAIALDVAWAMLPIPANLKTGALAPFAKVAGAIGLGLLAVKFMGKKNGEAVLLGAATVAGYNALKGVVKSVAPNLQLGDADHGYPGLEYVQAGPFLPPGSSEVGEYISGYGYDGPDGVGVGEYISGY